MRISRTGLSITALQETDQLIEYCGGKTPDDFIAVLVDIDIPLPIGPGAVIPLGQLKFFDRKIACFGKGINLINLWFCL